jgi:hypothetical protein
MAKDVQGEGKLAVAFHVTIIVARIEIARR